MTEVEMEKPNVVVILADDLGFSDLGCYGSEIPTPNLDRLASRGIRMSSFYTTPRCSPTRASLMTGKHSHEVGIGVLTRPIGYPGSLDPEVPTMASLLADQGYTTALSGKWHLASDVTQPNASWPTRRGFQHFFGILGGGTSYFNPKAFYEEETPVSIDADEDFYLTDALTTDAQNFIVSSAAENKPFFLYLAYTAPHWPLHARPEDIENQRGRYQLGWDSIRERRHERMHELGLFPRRVPLSPPDESELPWDEREDTDWQQRRMEVYAAQIIALDRGVGEILDCLESVGEFDNTLVMFLSDNGAEAAELVPGRSLAGHVTPGETRSGAPVQLGNDPSVLPGAEDTFGSYGRAWANVSNTPFRFYKKWVHEGGISSPMIVSWPSGGLSGGGIHHEPQHVVDILPTVLEATGTPQAIELAGESFLAGARGEPTTQERVLCWEHIGNAAIRRGQYKLERESDQAWELYDLENDRSELVNIAAARPDLVAELSLEWQKWADNHGVIPWDDLVEEFALRGLPRWQASS